METALFRYGYQDEYNKLKYYDPNIYYIILDEGAQRIYKGVDMLPEEIYSFTKNKPDWNDENTKDDVLYIVYDNTNINLYLKGDSEAEGMLWMGGSTLRPGLINAVDLFEGSVIADSTEEFGEDDQSIPTTGAVAKQLGNLSSVISGVSESLANYYTKDESYSQNQVNELITQIPKFTIEVVKALPEKTSASLTTVYLVPAEGETENIYAEYICLKKEIDEEIVYSWERLGEQKADLTNYVKNTDVATKSSTGLVYTTGQHGLMVTSSGQLRTAAAEQTHIDGKEIYPYPPITPKNLDYAVKVGIVTNTFELNDAEKTAAQKWLGISDHAKTADKATNADVSSAISSPNGKKATLPDLAEDAVLAVVDDIRTALVDYYTKNNTYSRDEVDERLSVIPKFAIEVVSSLPTTDISETTVYLVADGTETDNIYIEYIYVNNNWEKLGEQKISLTGYATETFVINGYQPKGDYALKTDIPPVRNMDFVGAAAPAYTISDGSTSNLIIVSGNVYAATNGAVATQNGETFIYDGTKWNSIKVKMPAAETLTVTGIDEDGNSHTWNIWGVTK